MGGDTRKGDNLEKPCEQERIKKEGRIPLEDSKSGEVLSLSTLMDEPSLDSVHFFMYFPC